jgi:hypothetical protein
VCHLQALFGLLNDAILAAALVFPIRYHGRASLATFRRRDGFPSHGRYLLNTIKQVSSKVQKKTPWC